MTPQEQQMFGISKAGIHEQYINSLTSKTAGIEMTVMSILSDCQELIGDGGANGLNPRMDGVRKQLNIAKFILVEMMANNRKAA